jgi:hypothetical protein
MGFAVCKINFKLPVDSFTRKGWGGCCEPKQFHRRFSFKGGMKDEKARIKKA